VLAAVIAGLAIALLSRIPGRRSLAVAALIGMAGGAGLYGASSLLNSRCTARNAAGQRIVIGTEFTEAGRKYHIANPGDDKNAILEALGGLSPQQAWTQASIDHCVVATTMAGALWMPAFGAALISAVALISPLNDKSSVMDTGGATVFISYNHEDAGVAIAVRDYLTKNRFEVIIDRDSMAPGQRIEDFIESSIRRSGTVISIVSNRSLLSTWVGMETIEAFRRLEGDGSRRFLACYLSEDHMDHGFRLQCTRQIDERLAAIEELITQYAAEKLDTVDLNEEKSRLYELRNNLGSMLARLRETLCLDLQGPAFEQSCRAIVTTIKSERHL
jgi:hypothetical protein